MPLADKYNPKETEEKWYQYWLENRYFNSTPDNRPAYTVVIPPPNVTGILHMGHMLNNTIQDVLVRRARMRGKNALWVPGTDHASIATEAKVVSKLKAEGIEKSSLSREDFLKHAWEWTDKYGGTILEQLKKLGASCDWERTRFTMEPKLSAQVIKSFVELYKKGLIYRGHRMVNWDPEALTNISDEEVIFKEQNGKLYFLKYQVEGTSEFLTVATTRPETIFGDTAVCVNPSDERYHHLKGKNVIVPIVGRVVPIIEDDYVDIEFGTGVLKITPAHDINDYTIGEKHSLEIIDSIDNHGKLNEHAAHYNGKDRFEVRKLIAKELKEKDLLFKEEDYVNKVGTSERTGAVIEPKISMQWFLKMDELARPALEVVMNDDIKFYPEKFKNTYKHWMENIRDWNISRQLWWGQQIPAYYYGSGTEDFVVAESKEEALSLAKVKTGNESLSLDDLTQDPDALDTWFSSWLWPMSVFDGLLDPENKDINYYFPTSDLVTGPDIIFFWVARMIMAGIEFRGNIPFKNVYFTGIVRDKQRRKMSKSLGNSPDPIELIESYGADGVRVGILLSSAAGNDLLFDEDLMLQGRNFATKIWNANRLMEGWEKSSNVVMKDSDREAISFMDEKLKEAAIAINEQFDKFRISDALHLVYKLIWDDFCAWYLEAIKPPYGEPISEEVYAKSIEIFEELLKLLHPFMPFLTEELWQNIEKRSVEQALTIAQQKEESDFDPKVISDFEISKEVISGIRNFRQKNGLSPRESVEVYVSSDSLPNEATILKLANVSNFHYKESIDRPGSTFLVGAIELTIPFSEEKDLEEEKNKTVQELEHLRGFLASVEKKLSNEKFVSGAPENVVALERKKQSDSLEKIALLEAKLNSLN